MAQKGLSYRHLVVFLIFWLLLFALWRWYQGPREAEARFVHMRHVLAVLTEYVRQHQGAWPRSWEEIEKTPVPPDAPPRHGAWPDVRAHVKVDFNVDPRKLLQNGPDQFYAVSPKGRCSGDYREDVQRLLEAIREALPPQSSPEKAAPSVSEEIVGKAAQAAQVPSSKLSQDDSAGSTSSKPQPADTVKKQPPSPSPTSKESESVKSFLPTPLPGLPEQTAEKPPVEKPTAPQPGPQEPSGKQTSQPPAKQPSRIILPGLD
ncbi:MAG: hypothetical protein NZ602_06585 [Thermoguttaceae bacterium]|nr:hypothetical protein [Thermoguttaceae bacterium]MDW8036948.1 hypothetical protein [Thermoguttaceae bacterium]